jgi:methionyl-tRNA formyltransferase
MKIVFAGSSEFAISALEELHAEPAHTVLLAISQPPRPKGRKQLLEATPLAQAAQSLGIPTFCPEDVNSPDSLAKLAELEAEILITASYGAFLGKTLRKLYPHPAINLHPSLLPLHRGPSPIRAAILAGQQFTGTSIFRLSQKMDAGPILIREQLEIEPNEDYSSLHTRLANQAARLLLCYLQKPSDFPEHKQDHALATYSRMVVKDDLHLNFKQPAELLNRQIRAYACEPGAYVNFRDKQLKILQAEITATRSVKEAGSISGIFPGTGFSISTADYDLKILMVQSAGKKQMDARQFILGARLEIGERIE